MIETFGYIIKEAKLHTLDSNILENTFVLESTAPFPGYHGENIPSSNRPNHIYLVTRKNYGMEKIIRTSREIQSFFNHSFGARPAELHMFNMIYPAIRVQHLEALKYIVELQQWFEDMGIDFMKKKNFNKPAIIRVTKHFRLEQNEEGIFQDMDDPWMYYLEISMLLSWKKFETITRNIKNNLDNNNFDAASGVIYIGDIMDVVRIYEENPSIQRLVSLKKMFGEEIRKLHL